LNCRLADDIQRQGGRVYVVGEGSLCAHDRAQQFLIPSDAGVFQSVLEVIPSQILAYKLAEAQGFKPGSVRYISKVITTESGIPGEQ
jgi:glucosamine 6-phosphate synthetase-like amidotransferase/phosphosugar isomerase protein